MEIRNQEEKERKAAAALERRFGKSLQISFFWIDPYRVKAIDDETGSWIVASYAGGPRCRVADEWDGADNKLNGRPALI